MEQNTIDRHGPAGAECDRANIRRTQEGFYAAFGAEPQRVYSAPGRTELGGNHTDHQHGRVLAAAVNLDILAAVTPNDSGVIRVQSEGYPRTEVRLCDLTPHPDEENTTAALIRGVAARFVQMGCAPEHGGLDAYVTSTVPGGSGLSSSAAFEVLMAAVLNDLWAQGQYTPVELAQIGQYAENVFFGKPCGLMDQTASAVGGVVAIDFGCESAPRVEQIRLDLNREGYALCILDSGADHADLTGEYAAITEELSAVCRLFGRKYLREVPEEEFMSQLPRVRREAGDRAALRAIHVYGENRRAEQEAQALKEGRFADFLALVRASGVSSALYLQNVAPGGAVRRQELLLTLALAERLLEGRGAVRVHGGGFGGTAQAFVPLECLTHFQNEIERVLGQGSCHVVNIRPVGGVRLI